jgi:hypothetical protein
LFGTLVEKRGRLGVARVSIKEELKIDAGKLQLHDECHQFVRSVVHDDASYCLYGLKRQGKIVPLFSPSQGNKPRRIFER